MTTDLMNNGDILHSDISVQRLKSFGLGLCVLKLQFLESFGLRLCIKLIKFLSAIEISNEPEFISIIE